MSAPLVGTVVGDRFVLEELTGSGGMGEVYRARDRESGERVAVKMLHAGGQSHVDRFLREARALPARSPGDRSVHRARGLPVSSTSRWSGSKAKISARAVARAP